MKFIEMSDFKKRLSTWIGLGVTMIGMIVISATTLGGHSRQIEINTKDVLQLETENRTDHVKLQEDVNQLKIDVAVIKEWVLDQKK